ncbi:MAG: TylF/MycF/NovP-related O-methyltransferase [Candidatus Sericytochromatia bacterium]
MSASPNPAAENPESIRLRQLYLEMVKRSVGDFLYDFDGKYTRDRQTSVSYTDLRTGRKHLISDYEELKENGLIGSNFAHTLIGRKRLDQLQEAVETVIREGIPGDLIETGVLRGGACIFMRAILEAYQERARRVWVADSFVGFPEDTFDELKAHGMVDPAALNRWAAPLEEVQATFQRYGLLDEQVQFLKGWFADTLPQAPIQQLAILRLDADLYSATRESLELLYPKLSPGGYLIVDDYYAFDDCRKAVREYRAKHGIEDTLVRVDPACVYWRKSSHPIDTASSPALT